MPHVSPEKCVALTLWETPQQLLGRERNFVKDAMMATAGGNDGQLIVLQEGDTYMVFDVRDNKCDAHSICLARMIYLYVCV